MKTKKLATALGILVLGLIIQNQVYGWWPWATKADEKAYATSILNIMKKMSERYDTIKSLPSACKRCCAIASPEGICDCLVQTMSLKAERLVEALALKEELLKLGKPPVGCKEMDEKFLKVWAKYEQFVMQLFDIPQLKDSLSPCNEYHAKLKRLADEYEDLHAQVRVVCQTSLR